jgi:hypothetical protein
VLLRSKIPNEPKGRTVKMADGTDYHFRPNAEGFNECHVTDEGHINRLLEIAEGYEPADPELRAKLAPKAVQVAAAADPLKGTDKVVDTTKEPVPADTPPGQVARSGRDYNGLTRNELEAEYEKTFGAKAHPNMKDSTILARLMGEDPE